MSKQLYIVTGPPGAGKSSFIQSTFPELFKYGSDMGNKNEWHRCPESCVLETAAPSKENKEYWIHRALGAGFSPRIYTIWVPFWTAYDRMKARSGTKPGQRNDIQKSVQQWYSMYSHHENEIRVNNE